MNSSKLVSESFPNAIDFGFCTVDQSNSRSFSITNNTKQQVSFNFDSCAFTFEPQRGSIPPRSSQEILITFRPREATVVVANTVLYVDNEPPRIIKLSAIGKYPYININPPKLDFEYLLFGKKATKDLIIKNISQVPAKFEIRKVEEDHFKDNSFSFNVKTGEIAPQASFLVKVTYEPKIVFLDSVVHFEVVCHGGNTIPFQCRGCAMGFEAQLTPDSVDFGNVNLGHTVSREITLQNNNDLPTTYQFFADRKNVFSFSSTSGVVNAASTARITVTFNPKVTMVYYERVFCLIANHQVLYVDLLGVCSDLIMRPKPILQSQVNLFRRRVIQGKFSKTDMAVIKTIDPYQQSSRLTSASKLRQLYNPDNSLHNATQEDAIMELPVENPSQVVLHKELFQELSSPNRLISVNAEYLDFGYCSPLTISPQQEIEVTNNFDYKVTLCWVLQQEKSDLGTSLTVFNIYPVSATIKPKSSQVFNVTFRPTKGASYFFQKLQFFAVRNDPKQNSIFNRKKPGPTLIEQSQLNMSGSKDLIIEDEVQPPICGSIPCVGHSFSLNSQTFIPILNVSPSNKVYFKPCSTGETMYATVQLINKTDTPVYYKFGYDTNKIFRVYPICGLIEGNSFNIVCFEFTPKEPKTYSHVVSCSLNHNLSDQLTFKLHGYCFEPKLELQNNGDIYFPPSFTGVVSKQKFKIHNTSRVALEYRIQVPKKYENELYLEPKTSILKPNEVKHLLSSFIPYHKKNYKISVPVQVFNVIDPLQSLIGFPWPGSAANPPHPERHEVQYKIHVFGVGGDGSLSITPSELKFGIVKVNFSERRSFTIENFSNITFYVKLNLTPKGDKLSEEMKRTVVNSFKLDFEEGKVAGNSKLDVGITFTPLDIFAASVELECIATEKNPKAVGNTTGKVLASQKCSLKITAEGSYPKLKFVDVRNDSISVSTLWENFSINKINSELLHNLNEDERKYNKIEQLTFEEAQQLQKRLECFKWNFGYLSNKQPIKPRKVVITVENIGGTDLKWRFQFPSDDYVSTEPWADPGEPTEEEAFEKAMIEKKIFEVKPREGELKAGERCDIELFYSPSFDDRNNKGGNRTSNEKHFLRVVFQIVNGKPIGLELNGTTLAPLKGLLAIRKTHYTLPPVPIGSLLPAYYPIEIQNVGTGKITYKVETEALNTYSDEKIKTSSKLLDIQGPKKTLNANEKSYLYCLFKPLEAKKYEFNLPIVVSDFIDVIHTINLTLTGQGYNTKPPRDEQAIKEEIPRQRSIVSSSLGSKVFFSIEELDFGEVESQKPQYRLILLYNASKEKRLKYEVFTYGLECEDTLIIDPNKGEIEPETFVQLKITLIPNITPSFYEGEVEFGITWLSQDYHKDGPGVSHAKHDNEDKELLFLRIKKKSKFLDEKKKFIPLENITNVEHKEDKHLFEIILSKVFNDILNDPATDEMLSRIEKLPVQLYDQFDSEEPANIHKISSGIEDRIVRSGPDYTDFRNMFFLDEFTDIVDIIMENTFFNIIQHTTLKEIDLLKPSKIYLTPI